MAKRTGSDERTAARAKRAAVNVRRAADAAREAARHSKIRRDHAGETAEDYVELIAHLCRTRGEARTVEIAERLGVSHVTVTKTIRRLVRAGLVSTEPYRSIFLTDQGRALAEKSADRHELVVRFLRAVGVEAHIADQDAEGIEHHVSEATLAAMRKFIDERGA